MKRTIFQVIEYSTEKLLSVKDVLSQHEVDLFKLRRRLKGIGMSYHKGEDVEPHLVCPECLQPLGLSGSKFGDLYFKHFTQSMECPLKVIGHLTHEQIRAIRYNGQKEGYRHRQMKMAIAEVLRLDTHCSDVKTEKRRYNESLTNWKVPDVSCVYDNQQLVLEIQLSTTFLDVIIARETFYQEQHMFIMWVFADFTQDGRLFTEKDTYVANHCNAFVLDSSCIAKSRELNKLVLRCHYKVPYIENLDVYYKWEDRYVTLDELTFDTESYKVYYFDFDKKDIETRTSLKQHILANTFERYWITRDSLPPEDCYQQDRAWIGKFEASGYIPTGRSQQTHFPSGLFQLLNAMYSMKHRRMIGFRYKNNIWRQMTNSFLTRHPEYAGSYIAALKHFDLYDRLNTQDKNGFMKATEAKIKEGTRRDDPAFRQNLNYKPLLKLLFCEIYE